LDGNLRYCRLTDGFIGWIAGKLAAEPLRPEESLAMNPHSRSRALWLGLGLCLAAPAVIVAAEEADSHTANDVYQGLLRDGLTLAGTHVGFPPPLLSDGDTREAEQAALRKLAGSDSAVQELLRNSVTAPQILKLHDERASDGTMIRVAELWFVVHAGLQQIDPSQLGGRGAEAKPVEAGNMRFSTRLVDDVELKKREITRSDPSLEWYSHTTGDLLDRIHVEATDHVRATRSEQSWVFASRTDTRFNDDPQYPNQWTAVDQSGKLRAGAAPQRFGGGASTTTIRRLGSVPGALLVEGRFAFSEPRGWFDGAPILRSKISLVAQDQVRRLRRELAQGKPTPPVR
jgi:hypothetical protein